MIIDPWHAMSIFQSIYGYDLAIIWLRWKGSNVLVVGSFKQLPSLHFAQTNKNKKRICLCATAIHKDTLAFN